MKNLDKYKGVIPAFYACYDKDGNVDPEGVKTLTRYFIEKGVKGLYVNGSSGECIYLTVKERKDILEAVMEEARGKLTVIAHVACNSTRESVELAKHAQDLGVDAIASIPPIYFKLPEAAIAKYWKDMSAAAPDTDFIIYNIPQLAGVSLTIPLLKEMMKNERLIGVKNSSMPTLDIETFKSVAGEDYVIFNGPDEQFISGRVMGAEAGIGGTYGAMPDLYLKLDDFVKNNEMEKAYALQAKLNNVIRKLCSSKGSMYAVIKAVLKLNEGFDIGGVRAPFINLSDEDELVVKEAAAMINELRQIF